MLEVLLEVCNQTNLQFKKILNALKPMPETVLTKRLRAYANDDAAYTEGCKRMYINNSDVLVEPMPPPPKLAESAKNLMTPTSAKKNHDTQIDWKSTIFSFYLMFQFFIYYIIY